MSPRDVMLPVSVRSRGIRNFLITVFLAGSIAGAAIAEETRPNIIFILADDLGWRDVGFAGAEFFETPHLDQLAAQGMTFSAAYSGGPNCAPTRGCLMSGTYTPRHQIYTPGGKSKGNPKYMRLLVPAVSRKNQALARKAAAQFAIKNSLDPAFVCIPEVLKPAGYTCARLGKWHLGEDTQGFDLSSSNGKGGPGGKFYGNVDVAEQLTDRALQFIEENKKGPFFLYLQGRGLNIDVPGGKQYSWRGFPSTSLRRGDWKLIEFHEDNSVGLYNLNDDPGEEKNLAGSKPEVAARLRTELDAWQAATKAPVPRVPNPECILSPRGAPQPNKKS